MQGFGGGKIEAMTTVDTVADAPEYLRVSLPISLYASRGAPWVERAEWLFFNQDRAFRRARRKGYDTLVSVTLVRRNLKPGYYSDMLDRLDFIFSRSET